MHAAKLVRDLLDWNQQLTFSGIGGQHMEQAGVTLISDLARYGVTGFTEVFRHLFIIKKALAAIKAHLTTQPPDMLILIDYPGFNLRLAQFARKALACPIIYYISPQIWAWKANRIHTIKACVDHMAVILPFEKHLYAQAGVAASFVGHPLISQLPDFNDPEAMRTSLGLPTQRKLVALLPGSRRNEVVQHMPVLADVIQRLNQRFPDLHFVIPVAPTIKPAMVQAYLDDKAQNITLLKGQSLEAAFCSDCVVVASGTASLECALLAKPMCIIYKASLLTYLIAMKVIKVLFLGLCNLLADHILVPEFLQYD